MARTSLRSAPPDSGMRADDAVVEGLAARLGQQVTQSTAARVANAMRDEVADGKLTPGMRLREQGLVDALGVSRNTLREALSQLIAERLLIREPNRGVSVRLPDVSDIRDLYRARLVIEPAAVLAGGQGLMRGSDHAFHAGVLRELGESVAQGRIAAECGDWGGVSDANQRFHRSVAALAGSARIDEYMILLLAEMRLVFHRIGPLQEFHEPYVEQNAAIARLIEDREFSAASEQVSAYLTTTMEHVVDAYSRL